MRTLLGIGFLFALAYLACLFMEQELNAALWILIGLVWLGLWGVGLALLAVTALQLRQHWPRHRQRLQGLIVLAVVSAPLLVHCRFGSTWARDVRFQMARSAYETRAQQLLRSPQSLQAAQATREVAVDRTGGKTRIAFVQPGGILDNWTALVYDPSGEVEKINAARDWQDWESSRFSAVRKLFHGDLTYAHPLGGGWYRCSFT